MKPPLAILVCLLTAFLATAQEEQPGKYRKTIDKGLAWLVKQQAKDGSWSADGGTLSAAMTAYAGMALRADGNTLTEGKYKANVRRAVDWFLKQRPDDKRYDGALCDPDIPANAGRYMMHHGLAMSFLAQLYTETEDAADRAILRNRLRRAVAFAAKAQNSLGGWFYTSVIEGHDSSENAATLLVFQGLKDARDAGIAVPKETLRKAHDHLLACTTERGGIVYIFRPGGKGPPVGGERPTFTVMALAAYLPEYGPRLTVQRPWLEYCAEQEIFAPDRKELDLFPHYFLTRVACNLREEQWRATFPDKKMPDHLNWQKYRGALFDRLQREQQDNGSWPNRAWGPGSVFNASLALNILTYERSPYSR